MFLLHEVFVVDLTLNARELHRWNKHLNIHVGNEYYEAT